MNKFLMQQAQKLQAKLAKAQEELSNITVEASSGGGAVKVTMNGQQKIQSVKISPEVINPDDVELLEDLRHPLVGPGDESGIALRDEDLHRLFEGFESLGVGLLFQVLLPFGDLFMRAVTSEPLHEEEYDQKRSDTKFQGASPPAL